MPLSSRKKSKVNNEAPADLEKRENKHRKLEVNTLKRQEKGCAYGMLITKVFHTICDRLTLELILQIRIGSTSESYYSSFTNNIILSFPLFYPHPTFALLHFMH